MTVRRRMDASNSMDRKYFHKCKSYLVNAMGILKESEEMNNTMILNSFIKKEKKNYFCLENLSQRIY